ncbi:DMT family transporter [Actinokineospora sp. NBRC 105648]|uniref:DMT family transporter n=1 Tax=Actinokineospora sp. NBRC 105648 TaxID=3032206 RepID=UPI0024A2DE1B|nr:DMT family transporter [Actinokineospora sp. NBRC 105648]GLZ40922.1 membrane protein [Actinokineospora sp. NBRC 105648]
MAKTFHLHRGVIPGIVLLSLLWGGAYLVIDVALRGFPPVVVVLGRATLAFLFLLPFALRRKVLSGLRQQPGWLLLTVFLQATAPLLLLTLGQELSSPAMAGILIGAQPLFVAVLALKFDPAERPQGIRGLLGLFLGLAGLLLLFGLDLSGGSRALLGGLFLVAAAFCYACGALLIHKRLTFAEPLGIATVAMGVSTAVLLAPGLLALPEARPTTTSTAALLTLGIIFTGVTLNLNYWLIQNAGPARATLAFYLSPGVAVLLSWLLLDEYISWSTVLGLLAIVAGSGLAARRGQQ